MGSVLKFVSRREAGSEFSMLSTFLLLIFICFILTVGSSKIGKLTPSVASPEITQSTLFCSTFEIIVKKIAAALHQPDQEFLNKFVVVTPDFAKNFGVIWQAFLNSKKVRTGTWTSFDGKTIYDVVALYPTSNGQFVILCLKPKCETDLKTLIQEKKQSSCLEEYFLSLDPYDRSISINRKSEHGIVEIAKPFQPAVILSSLVGAAEQSINAPWYIMTGSFTGGCILKLRDTENKDLRISLCGNGILQPVTEYKTGEDLQRDAKRKLIEGLVAMIESIGGLPLQLHQRPIIVDAMVDVCYHIRQLFRKIAVSNEKTERSFKGTYPITEAPALLTVNKAMASILKSNQKVGLLPKISFGTDETRKYRLVVLHAKYSIKNLLKNFLSKPTMTIICRADDKDCKETVHELGHQQDSLDCLNIGHELEIPPDTRTVQFTHNDKKLRVIDARVIVNSLIGENMDTKLWARSASYKQGTTELVLYEPGWRKRAFPLINVADGDIPHPVIQMFIQSTAHVVDATFKKDDSVVVPNVEFKNTIWSRLRRSKVGGLLKYFGL